MIETERLELIPLPAGELRLLLEDIILLEKTLDCEYRAEPIEGHFRQIVDGQLKICEKDPQNFVWHTFWLIIRKSDRTVVGSADFKAPPVNGEVEIGYGLGSGFEHQGYMTETVKAMCGFAFDGAKADTVIAEIETENFASQRVLSRCGFRLSKRGETLWWRLDRPKSPNARAAI